MAGRLFGSAASGNSAPPAIAGFKVQTAVYGLPIPIIYGQARVGGNLIHMYPSTATPQLSQGSRNKFVKIDQQVTGYLYQAPIAIALSEGPILGIGKVWRDKDASVPWSTYQAAGWSLFLGSAAQAAWSFLTSNHPSDAAPYQLTAYVAHALLELPNDVLSNYTWEVQGLFQVGTSGIVDANPKDIVTDSLTNADHGVGFPSAQLGDLTAYAQYCLAAGLCFSPVFNGQSPLADQLLPILEASNAAPVWSDGKLKILPYADQPITGNGTTYTPNVTPLYDLTDNDYLAPEGTDPVKLIRKKPAECFNQLTVEYEDRAHDYNPNVQEWKDQASIDAYGLRPAPAFRCTAIKDASTARYVAQLKGQREISVRDSYEFTLGMRYCLLEPMDLVTLTDVGLGLNKAPVRLTEITEDADGNLTCIAEEFPAGIASASRYGAAGANGTTSANNVAPGPTTSNAIFEGPGPLAQSALEIWLAASGGANWGGCDVHLSTDNVTYTKVGSITRKGNFGALTAALPTAPVSPPNDTTNTLAVDLTASGGALVAGSASDLAALATLCLVENEFLAYQGASLTSAFHYNLTTLARGLFGSPIPASHAIGATFVRCDGAILKLPYPQAKNGQVVYFKFPAFNAFGLGLEDVATVTAVSHTIGKNTVTTGGAGIVNPPIAKITRTFEDEAAEDLQFDAQLGNGGIGPLTWSYQIDAAAPVTGTGGFPFTVSGIPRAKKYSKWVTLTVTQSDGQVARATYLLHGQLAAIHPGTGNIVDGTGLTALIDIGTKTIQPGLFIGNGVRGDSNVAFGATVKFAPNRHNEGISAKNASGAQVFGTSFETIPEIRTIPQRYSTPASGTQVEFTATGVSVSGFTPRAVSTTGATSAAQTNNFAVALNGATAATQALSLQANIAYCNLSFANSSLTTYTVVYDVDTSGGAGMAPGDSVTVRVWRNAGNTGAPETTWTLVGSKNYTSGLTLSNETIAFDAAMGLNWDIRVTLIYNRAPADGTAIITVKRTDYNVVTPGTETDLTLFTAASVLYQAVEKS